MYVLRSIQNIHAVRGLNAECLNLTPGGTGTSYGLSGLNITIRCSQEVLYCVTIWPLPAFLEMDGAF
jgi:hypothetical protein